jgi:hypothetical protein
MAAENLRQSSESPILITRQATLQKRKSRKEKQKRKA